MRAAVARSGRLEVREVPDPVPGEGEVLAAVKACGICGSDLHALVHADRLVEAAEMATAGSGMGITWDPDRDYVMGHEYAAEVLELGAGTVGAPVASGDLVTSLPFVFTPHGMEPVGAYSNEYNGGYADLLRLTAALCLRIPNGLDARRAALTEPMAVGRHAAARAGLAAGESALVVGAGPVGLAVIAELARLGVEPVVAADYSPRRRSVAAAMGAHVVVDPVAEEPIEAWRRTASAFQPVVLFDAVGVPGTIERATVAAPPLSRIVVVGSCMEPDSLRPIIPQVKQLSLVFSFGYGPDEFADTLRDIAEGAIDVTPMITGVCGVEGVPAAFEALGRPEEHVKILVEPGGPPEPVPV